MAALMVAISYVKVLIQLRAFKFYSTLIAYNKTSKTVIAMFQMCSVTSSIVLHQRLIYIRTHKNSVFMNTKNLVFEKLSNC